ncbi:MAG: DUF3857 domain-containing protein [Acidobacteriaceae bacterium]
MRAYRSFLAAAIAVLCLPFAIAQQRFETPAKVLLQSAGAADSGNSYGVTILSEDTEVKVDESHRLTERYHMVYRIDSPDAVEEWSSVGIRWSPWYQSKPKVHARVVTPDGVERELDPKVLSDAPAGGNRPELYDDERVISGPLPAVKVGAVVEEEEILEDVKPFFSAGVVHRYWFGRSIPIRDRRLTLQFPASFPLKYGVVSGPGISVRKEETQGIVRVVFTQQSIAARELTDANLPSDVAPRPYVVFATASSWGAVAAEYNKIVEAQIASADLKAVANARKGRDRSATIANLLAYLHEEVRYTGVEFDEANLVPQSPSEVLKRKFGDCKDKSALMVALLRAAGIPADLALLNMGPGLDSDPEYPGMGVFDHAIVYVPGTPELWIDTTAEFNAMGVLPYADEGRLALVVSADSTNLRRTPESSSEANLTVETREFQLADYGKASVTETSQPSGDLEATYRSMYGSTESKDDREELENYVKNEYLADALTKLDHGNGAELSKPFQLVLHAAKARRGFTDLDSAVVAIRYESLFTRFPQYMRYSDEDNNKERAGESIVDAKSSRTDDVVYQPFITEWRYRIKPPAGFRVRSLPPAQTLAIGPAELSYRFEAKDNGEVTGVVRFDSRKGRYTVAEAKATRKAYQELTSGDPLLLSFDEAGAAEIAAGNVKQALAAERKIVANAPNSSIARVHLARALLSAGLGDMAREEASRAVALDPHSATAARTLGWVLEHDLIGRRLMPGFDQNGAVAAYRKAIEIDPKDIDLRAELAIVLEHDLTGERYSPKAKLIEAVAEYRELSKVDEQDAHRYDNNLLTALLYARQFKDVDTMFASLAQTRERLALELASIAAQQGADAAVSKSKTLARNAGDRLPALRTAAFTLRDMRLYAPAAALLAASAESDPNAAQFLGMAQVYRQTRRHEEVIDPSSPTSTIQRLFVTMLGSSSAVTPDVVREFEYVVDVPEARKAEALARLGGGLRNILKQSGIPAPVGADIILSNMKFNTEGNDTSGYRIRVQPAGAKSTTAFVLHTNKGYKLIGFDKDVTGVGIEVLRRVDGGDLAGARQLLDWAREEISLPGGDDPLAWPAFPRLYQRGENMDAMRFRRAAYSLIADTEYVKPYVSAIKEMVAQASEADRPQVQTMLASAYRATKQWPELQATGADILQKFATSDFAFGALMDGCTHTKDWQACDAAIDARLTRLPNDPVTVRARARAFEWRMKYSEARTAYQTILDSGRATESDMNSYGWDALFTGTVSGTDLDVVQRGSSVSQNNNYSIVHTLACLYAEIGKTKEARELLLHTIDLGGLDEPDSQVWYGLGRIDEQYGETDAALRAYGRMKQQEGDDDYPTSMWNLGQIRLRALKQGSGGGH